MAEDKKRRRGGFIDKHGRPEVVAAPFIAKGAAAWRMVSEPDEDKSDDTTADSE